MKQYATKMLSRRCINNRDVQHRNEKRKRWKNMPPFLILKNFICLEKDRNLRQERKCIIVALNLLERGFTVL
jgi:hypothetical protein